PPRRAGGARLAESARALGTHGARSDRAGRRRAESDVRRIVADRAAAGGSGGVTGILLPPAARSRLPPPKLSLTQGIRPPPAEPARMRSNRRCLSSSVVSSMRVAMVHTCPDGSIIHAIRSPQNWFAAGI